MRDAEIRDRFREGTQPRGEIDVDAVLRRARARRRPRVLLAGGGGVLAVLAIAVPAALTSSLPLGDASAGSVAEDAPYVEEQAAPADESGGADLSTLAKADKLNLCGAPVAEYAPAANGLVITVAPMTAAAAARDIPVTVTLTNAGDARIVGTTGSRPALTLADDGVTVWHTNGPGDLMARVVDLSPGQSMSYAGTFDPVRCSPADESAEAFPADLPQLDAGVYRLSAVIEVTNEDGTIRELVSGPAVDVSLE